MAPESLRSEAELQKLNLEVQKLTLDVESGSKFARVELILRLLPTLTVLVGVLGFGFTVWQYRTQQSQQSAKESVEREAQAQRDMKAAEGAFMSPLLEKQQQLYFEASEVAATIATSKDLAVRQKAEARFWILYWGPLVMVEREEVSGAMKKFGYCLDGSDKCSTVELKDRSLRLSSALETSLLRTWNANPEGFTKNQFIYK